MLGIPVGLAIANATEWAFHRYILHGRFPVSRNPVKRLLHEQFDHLHWEHHARPWDGNHINGNGTDTGPFVLALIGLSFLTPFHTWPVFVAALMQSYIVEEWIHHSVHFYHFDNLYFRYIKRHHPIHVHGFSPSEVDFFATVFRMDPRDVIRELKTAGLDSIPGGGGEILVQRVRDIVAPKKAGADRWLEVMELA